MEILVIPNALRSVCAYLHSVQNVRSFAVHIPLSVLTLQRTQMHANIYENCASIPFFMETGGSKLERNVRKGATNMNLERKSMNRKVISNGPWLWAHCTVSVWHLLHIHTLVNHISFMHAISRIFEPFNCGCLIQCQHQQQHFWTHSLIYLPNWKGCVHVFEIDNSPVESFMNSKWIQSCRM